MIKVSFVTLGCPKNEVDTDYMMGITFNDDKYKYEEQPKEADVIVINTCGFIEDAKEESIDTILQAAEYKKDGLIDALIVTGCLTQRYKTELMEEIKEIDAVLGTGTFDQIKETIDDVLNNKKRYNRIDKPVFDFNQNLERFNKQNHYSYVKIAEGCNNNCSYCSIPFIRGPLNSRKMEDIIKEIDILVENGAKEIILTAQDTTEYGKDLYGERKLVDLLKEVVKIKDLKWVRLLYSYPEHISQELIDVIKNNDKICNYLDIPVQHSSNKIRKQMRREGTKEELLNVINDVRKNINDVALRTSLIVGFPGETEDDFNNLLSFIKEVKFDRLGVFQYSREEGTKAALMANQIDKEIKQKRYNKIMEIQQNISYNKNKELIDRGLDVIIDEEIDDEFIGRTVYDAPEIDNTVYVKGKNISIGDIVKVKITNAFEYDLMGEKIYEST
ncbi:MAG TPA: 30S ribosomal protein S12 methylthiotransferase RimO [Halanaerobiales bacterium]|nr:30S ribosomal protein S12 methylthiotransferase RimO [Halanaerobiales bacterium]